MKRLVLFCETYVAGGSDKIARILADNVDFEKVVLLINKNSNKRIFEEGQISKNCEIFLYELPTIAEVSSFSNKFTQIKSIMHLVKIISFFVRYPLFLFSIIYFYFLLKKLNVGVFVSNNGGYPGGEYNRSSTIAASLIKGCKVFHIFHSMALPYRKVFKKLEVLIDNYIDRNSVLITDSIISANRMKKVRSIKQDIKVLYNGVKPSIQKQYIQKNSLELLHIGTLDSNKNQLLLLKVLNQLVHIYHCDIKVKLIGKEAEEGYLKSLKGYISEKKLEEHVCFVGFSDEPYVFYNSCDLLLLTSNIESFPTVILEAMSVGMPVITTNAGGVSEQLQDNLTGFIVDINDIDIFVEKVLYFYKNRKEIERFGNRSYYHFHENFTLKKMISNYNRLLKEGNE